VATKFGEVFWGCPLRQVSMLNRRFEDHLGHNHQGPDMSHHTSRNVGSVQTTDVADSPRRLHLKIEDI
jgi:hypothetical protein